MKRMMKNISILGSTGSIGSNVLAVVRQFPEKYKVVGLAAGRNVESLYQQVLEFEPEYVSVIDEVTCENLASRLPRDYAGRIFWGLEGNKKIAAINGAEIVISAIVGAAGLIPTLTAIEAGKDIGLANKETLVMAGKLVMESVAAHGVNLIPVDSEHSAIFQALSAGRKQDVAKIILTASGGPFLNKSMIELHHVTPDQALAHPNWDMGRKISIDSATLMNKGLEVIEAKWLFDVSVENIDVVVHPQSIVHSLVEYQDGSVLAQLGIPDMRIPIAYALSYPERLDLSLQPLQLSQCGNLEFTEPDYDRFPSLKLAFDAISRGGVMPAVLNAANEVAVDGFLNNRITFLRIAEIVSETMKNIDKGSEDSLDDILAADNAARDYADVLIDRS